ncbi:Fpg/Nei family DNA glycosylase [Thiohalorhabdus sp.]|uniref:Fpg/Nei family DNA glycosylase n=1 Tax=Thiohalorhabdus sp. TaxID=3094134 RepID=UPI002FC31538
MPELPDVETFRRYLDANGLHQTIEEVAVADERVVKRASPAELADYLQGHRLERTYRRGKHLFAALDGEGWLELHFGMTGYLAYYRDPGEAPDYGHVRLAYANGYQLAFVDRRKLGYLAPVRDLAACLAELELGIDALDPELDAAAFRELAKGRRVQVKCWLMDQASIAGIGNVYSDEILFHAGIYPRTPLPDLDWADLDRLHGYMSNVLKTATDSQVQPGAMPGDFLVPLRKVDDAACPRCGTPLAKVKACGRTSQYCPTCQPTP